MEKDVPGTKSVLFHTEMFLVELCWRGHFRVEKDGASPGCCAVSSETVFMVFPKDRVYGYSVFWISVDTST